MFNEDVDEKIKELNSHGTVNGLIIPYCIYNLFKNLYSIEEGYLIKQKDF